MKVPENFERIIDGKRYSVAKATLVAHDCYWDGHNWERHGRNTFLYKTPRGRFFVVRLTLWQGERDSLQPVSAEEAKELYEMLEEHELSYEEAFGVTPEDA